MEADRTSLSSYAFRMGLRRIELWQLCAVVTLAALLAFVLRSQRPLGENISGNPYAQSVRTDSASPASRNPAADLSLIVFTDYRCPACRVAHPAMKRAVESDGKVRVVYKEWPIFGESSARAAEVALASEAQGIYPLVHDSLMTAPSLDDGGLRMAVERAGGDWRRLERDLSADRKEILRELERNRTQALGLGLGGTPGYLIGPILVKGALGEREFKRVFNEARRANSGR